MKKFKSFIALDLKSNTQNINIVKKLYRHVYGFKVGYRSFYNDRSNELISEIKRKKSKLFLDLKLHDLEIDITGRKFEILLHIRLQRYSGEIPIGSDMIHVSGGYRKDDFEDHHLALSSSHGRSWTRLIYQ